MHKLLTTIVFVFVFAFVSHAQVDNYCLRFEKEGVVNLGRFSTQKAENPYTLQFWFCPSEWNEGAALLRCGAWSIKLGKEHSIVVNDGENHFFVTSNWLAAGKWAHVTVRSNKEGTTVHINNSKCLESTTRLTLPASDYSIWLGGDYRGRMDEVRLFRIRLADTYDSYWRNTLNDLMPCWAYLVGYWKMDQEQCANLVDYKGTHHGTFSASGVEKEKVTDNDRFKYLYSLAYGNLERYCDRQIDERHYRLSNRICIIAAHFNGNTGHITPDMSNEEATYNPHDGDAHLPEYLGRKGVLQLSREGFFTAPWGILDGASTYTIETWLTIDQWTEGGYIFRKETADCKQGISLRLGSEAEQTLIVRCNGTDFIYNGAGKVGKWFHVGLCLGAQTSGNDILRFTIDGRLQKPTNADDLHPSLVVTNLTYQGTPIHFGLNLQMKLDDTMVFSSNRDAASDMKEVPLPGPDRAMAFDQLKNHLACYSYDLPHRLTLDAFSVPGLFYRMRTYTEGLRGVKYILGVAGNNFQSWFAKPDERGRIADEITAIAKDEVFDGVDLDFEWPSQLPFSKEWEDYAHVCEALHWRLLDYGKTKSISPHYVSCKFPVSGFQQYVDYFNFQVYDRKDLFTTDGFDAARQLFEAYNYPKAKTILSYATTTTQGYKGGSADASAYPQAYRYLYPGEENYDPTLNYMSKDGYDYWLNSYNQVIWRAKYITDHDLGGIMYWDMGGDLPSDHKHSFARAASYYINSNVEALVTEVSKAAVAPEADDYAPLNTENPDQTQKFITSMEELDNGMAYSLINAKGLGSLCYNGNTSYVWLGESSNANFNGWVDYSDPGAQWLVINYQGKHYLYCIKPEKFVEVPAFDVTSQATFFTDEPKPIEVTEENGSFAFRTYTTEANGYLCASPQLKERPVCQWEKDDDGSRWMLRTMPEVFAESALRTALLKIDPTGVAALTTDNGQHTAVYDLQGRLYVQQPKFRGLYIKGRKVVLK